MSSGAVVWTGRVLLLAASALLFAAAAFGSTRLNANIAPVAIFVCWWVGLVPFTVLFGNVWGQINPWLTMARLLRLRDETKRELPGWVGWWPAAVLLIGWAWIELVYPTTARPRLIAGWMAAYTLLTLAGMWRYGVRRWLEHGEMFSVYTSVLSTMSPLALAHDRAVELSPTHGLAVASQGPMLVLMVALTVLGLWSLSEGMARI